MMYVLTDARRALQVVLLVLLVSLGIALAQEEPVGVPEGDDFRTEAEDVAAAETQDVSTQLGKLGAVEIPVEIPIDGHHTIALYTQSGQMVRILGQVLELEKGAYTARWDGMDLFGNLIPVGTELVVKVISNKPIRAIYEFSAGAPNSPPWGARPTGEGMDMRAGGWLGDHSPPGSAVAVGDRVLLGCFVAEHGSNLIGVTLDGQKMWGAKLAGWSGPTSLKTDGKTAYALQRRGSAVWRVDPATGKKTRLFSAGRDKFQSFAVSAERIYTVAQNHERNISPFTRALGNGQIDFVRSQPQVLNTSAPTEFHISPQAAFGNTFTSPGNPQNGARFVRARDAGWILLAFKKPVPVGTVVLGKIDGVSKVEVHALKPGLKYVEKEHSPLNNAEDALAEQFGIDELVGDDGTWIELGEIEPTRRLNVLPVSKADIETTAVYFRAVPEKRPRKKWKVGVAMARLMKNRFARVDAEMRVILPDGVARDNAKKTGRLWDFKTELPVSSIYPANVVCDFGAPKTFDAIAVLNMVNPRVYIDVFTGSGDPAEAPEAAWKEVGRYKGKHNKKLRHLSASKKANEQIVTLPDRLTTRAIRFRHESGFRHGKWGKSQDDAFEVETDAVALLRLAGERVIPPSHLFEVRDGDGKVLKTFRGNEYDIAAMDTAPDGTLYCVSDKGLCKAEVRDDGVALTVLNDKELAEPMSIDVTGETIAVGDRARHAVVLFDRDGTLRRTLGDRGPRKPGPWDPQVVHKPSSVALDARGNLWLAEESFAPKRVAVYDAEGKCIREFFGPPMYGGGGYLDPNLKRFYYRSAEYALDWEAGTSRLKNLNDTLRSPGSPAKEGNSFAYTGIGRPIDYKGRRYIVGSGVICKLEGPTWTPCTVWGSANNSVFLLGKDAWNKHWAKFDLVGKRFIWCDRNDDGDYQIDEVELFDADELPGRWRGMAFGPGFGLWGSELRAAPSAWTPGGVPIYTKEDFKPFDYTKLAPHYPRNYTRGGPRSAKPGYFGFKYVCEDGSMIQEGQPFIVQADGTILGGAPPEPSAYIPPIEGLIQSQPWKFAGGTMTDSDVGEIACVNSNNGYWYVWAAKLGCVVGAFFTGDDGGWGAGLSDKRGTDVTGRKQSWESWGAHFLRAEDGNCYAVAGKGFHGISRIEGLDDFAVREKPLTVRRKSFALNKKLRGLLVARAKAMALASSKSGRRTLTAEKTRNLPKKLTLDGEIDEWGRVVDMHSIGDPKRKLFFDVAYDDDGVYIAWAGETRQGNTAKNIRELFAGGFALDFALRPNARARTRDVIAGDRRIVIAEHKGAWTGVLYDYVDPKSKTAPVVYTSDVIRTEIARVEALGKGEIIIKVDEDKLGLGGFDDLTGETLEDFGETPEMPSMGGEKKDEPGAERPKDYKKWTAEVFIPWKVLGTGPGAEVRADFGVIEPDGDGGVRRMYWSNRFPPPTGDPGIDAMIDPATWGFVGLTGKKQ